MLRQPGSKYESGRSSTLLKVKTFHDAEARVLKHFQAHDINALIAPRPRLSLNGRKDLLTPPAGVERIRDHVLPLYAKYGKKEDCRIELFDCGHEETPEMRKLVLEAFDRYLPATPTRE